MAQKKLSPLDLEILEALKLLGEAGSLRISIALEVRRAQIRNRLEALTRQGLLEENSGSYRLL